MRNGECLAAFPVFVYAPALPNPLFPQPYLFQDPACILPPLASANYPQIKSSAALLAGSAFASVAQAADGTKEAENIAEGETGLRPDGGVRGGIIYTH